MSPLQMGINAHLLSPEAGFRSAGVHGYIYNLIRHLPAVSDTADFLYTVFVGQGQVPPNERMRVIRSSWPTRRPLIRILWEQTLLPRQKLDLLHATAFVAPLLAPWPTVVTVYDLSFIHYPHTFPAGRRLYLRLMTRLSCRRARRVIAISQSTRRDLVQQWKLPPDKIEVACPGVGEGFRPLPADAVTAFRRQRNLPRRFILHVGTLQPRKNLVRLVQAYSRLRAIEPAVKLVLAGGKGWQYDELLAEIERLYLKDDVMLPGYVPAEVACVLCSYGSSPAWPKNRIRARTEFAPRAKRLMSARRRILSASPTMYLGR